jgi:hypothetical protein
LKAKKEKDRVGAHLGEILGANDNIGSQIFETTPGNFPRTADLYRFLNRQCERNATKRSA